MKTPRQRIRELRSEIRELRKMNTRSADEEIKKVQTELADLVSDTAVSTVAKMSDAQVEEFLRRNGR